jgi:hypothetical protein
VLDRERGERRAQQRHGSERVAELLREHGQLDDAEALAAVLLPHRDAGPAEAAQLAPQRVVAPAGLGRLADLGERRAAREQLARRVLDRALVV